ncbi:tripartite tricarboxylate transporter substrate-binding protein [Roseomonas sp. CCTCC AB2023176]|uniref:tripartite tricarboxylate transporter substrate-binding protein n=1 Tax=Roseomonas sp. CCTCC AB2023176 TaxID=3342640 RepID=UPI0035D8C53C
MNLTRRATLAAAAALTAPGVLAQEGPVQIIVPYTPGTGHDILARGMAPFLGQRLGQPVVVDNRPGASGNIGSVAVSRAAPDGRVLMVQGNAFTINPALFRNVPYDASGGFTAIANLVRADMVLVVNPDVAVSDLRGFVALAKARSLDYGSPGVGTPQHMAMALLGLRAGFEANHVPYRGSAPAVQDVLGKRLACMFMPVHTALPFVAGGQVKPIAVAAARRTPAASDWPTLAEAGVSEAEVDLWYFVLGPTGMAPPLVGRLNETINAWLADGGTAAMLRAQGMTAEPTDPARLASMVAADVARWRDVVGRLGITAD